MTLTESDLIAMRVAQVNAATARALIRVAAMQAANSQHPENQPYTEKDILAVIDEECIGHNALTMALQVG